MRFILLQDGGESAPLNVEVLDEMIADGRAKTTDQVRPENSDAWVTIEQFVEFRKYGPPGSKPVTSATPPSLPPPLPADFPSHNPDRPVPLIGDKRIKGTENMTVRELEQLIRQGARVAMFSYCVSIVFMTFRRPSEIFLIRPGQSGFGPAFTYSMISILLGWWGIPWGPIYTIASLVTNAKGGTDLTEPLLSDLVGLDEVGKIVETRQQPVRGGGLKAVGAAVAALAMAVTLAVNGIRMADDRKESSIPSAPGSAAFVAANQALRKGREAGSGNTVAASAMAERTSAFINQMHGQVFEGAGAGSAQARTHCELHGTTCAFVVYISKLDSYKDDESRELLGQLAWVAAQKAVQEFSPAVMKVGVGVRDFSGYDRVLSGHSAGQDEEFMQAIESVSTGQESRDNLVPLFAELE